MAAYIVEESEVKRNLLAPKRHKIPPLQGSAIGPRFPQNDLKLGCKLSLIDQYSAW